MGLNVILIIAGVVVALLIIGIPIWNIRKTEFLKKAVESKVYVTTMKKSGARVNGLYPADEHTVTVKRPGGRTASISIDASNTFNMLYPATESTRSFLSKIFSPTVQVRSICVAEPNGGAWKPFEVDQEITDEGLEAIKKQAFTKAAMEAGYQYANPDGGRGGVKKMQLVIGSGITLVLLIAIGIMSYMTMTQLETVATGWGM